MRSERCSASLLSGLLFNQVGSDRSVSLGGSVHFEFHNFTIMKIANQLIRTRARRRPPGVTANRGVKVVTTLTINRPPADLYGFWMNLENLPRFMNHLQEVRVLDKRRSHWVAKAPAGRTAQWDAEIINQKANDLVAWRSCAGSEIQNAGSVRFKPAPAGRGTEMTVSLEYVPPGGTIGKIIAHWFGEEPAQQLSADLRRFKAMMETGEIPTTEGQPVGLGR